MKRYDLIDTLRGLEIISMIAFHACWIMNHFGLVISNEILFGTGFIIWERSICIGFIAIAGFSFSLGRRHLRSGLLVFGIGLLIMVLTCLFMPGMRIVFGILTFIGSAILLMIPLDKILAKVRSRKVNVALFFLFLFLFILFYNINIGYLGFYPDMAVALPKWLYKGYIAAYFGFMEPGFQSVDYFSILPWIFLYFCGYMFHKIIRGTSFEDKLIGIGIPGINVIGRHSLVIYLVHPAVLYVIIYFAAFVV